MASLAVYEENVPASWLAPSEKGVGWGHRDTFPVYFNVTTIIPVSKATTTITNLNDHCPIAQ